MRRAAGHASLFVGRLLHDLSRLAFLVFLLALLSVCALAFRLSIGPMELPGLASRLATAASGQGIHVDMDEAALAWGGWRQGGVPLYLQLGGIHITNAEGFELASIQSARLVFAPDALFGAGAPIIVESRDARFPGASVPVSLTAAIRLHRTHLAAADLTIMLGPGQFFSGPAINNGFFTLRLTPDQITLNNGSLRLAPHGASTPIILLSGTGNRAATWSGTLHVTVNEVQAADLGAYWPPGLLKLTRHWVLENVTTGTAQKADFSFGLSAPLTLSSLHLTSAAGSFAAHGVTLGWIPHAEPITNLTGHVVVQDLQTMIITGDSASLHGVNLSDGLFTISGMSSHHQIGALRLQLAGRVQDVLAVLNAPPLSLLRHAPPTIAAAAGDVAGTLTLRIPLNLKVRLADVTLGVSAQLRNTEVASPMSGLGFTNASLDLTATGAGLSLAGTALFAGEPATVSAQAVFSAHPAVQTFSLASSAGPNILHYFGLDSSTAFTTQMQGTAPFTLQVTPSPDGTTTQAAALRIDLSPAALSAPRFGWSKKPGDPASLALDLSLPSDGPPVLQNFFASGPKLFIMAQRVGPRIIVHRVLLGGTLATGSVQPPTAPNAPWILAFSGPVLDFRLLPKQPDQPKTAPQPAANPAPPTGPLWRLSLHFTQAYVAAPPAPALKTLTFTGRGQGSGILAAQLTTASPALALTISPAGGQRLVTLAAPDAGAVLRSLGLYENLQGGTLALDATLGGASLATGTATLTEFRLSHAPVFTKILQALTIYGVGAATSGPGLHFDQLVAPFTLQPGALTLHEARAYSASLGFTASGEILVPSGGLDLATTVIPAYALNALPGQIPVLGKLFTAEKGGGLFAINVHVTGNIADPEVLVNPLSVFTPGALRSVFQGASK
jgi:hypothetical protein